MARSILQRPLPARVAVIEALDSRSLRKLLECAAEPDRARIERSLETMLLRLLDDPSPWPWRGTNDRPVRVHAARLLRAFWPAEYGFG